MDGRGGNVDPELLAEIGSEIHRFVQNFPNHYAARALAALLNRQLAGEDIEDDERELVLLTLAREAKKQAGRLRFGRRPAAQNTIDENA